MYDKDGVCLLSGVTGITIVSGQTSFLLPKSHLCSDTHPHTQGTRPETGKSPSFWKEARPQHVTHSAVVEQVPCSPSELVNMNNNSQKGAAWFIVRMASAAFTDPLSCGISKQRDRGSSEMLRFPFSCCHGVEIQPNKETSKLELRRFCRF